MGGVEQVFVANADACDTRRTSVLVARIAGNVNPSFRSHEESRMRCLKALIQAAEISGGRVLREQRDTVLVLLGSADSAVAAAARMQAYANDNNQAVRLGVRIGVASAEVTQRNDGVLGDTMNLALEFSRQAQSGQILASESTAANLSPAVRRTVGADQGSNDDGLPREIQWRDRTTDILAIQKENAPAHPHTVLRLEYRGKTILRRREIEYVTFGRDPESHVVVTSRLASRRHCTVSRHDYAFIVQDHSTNGTFLMTTGEGEAYVHAEAARLGKEGWLCLGESGDESDEVIQYRVLRTA